ncbi:hypothetical protein NARC_100128 [Candidatus Nitrosocosmicus arcticus]|uniref:Uncharacterized protein n=1 Tax=Candidatus Nitrosocosmicus arcticus TaxID=2035267 RepID=A0A557STY4_9ARCH|nr:hypothetical protein NARC_100128 [Candidatus Nitrosocosmicus arcticus]
MIKHQDWNLSRNWQVTPIMHKAYKLVIVCYCNDKPISKGENLDERSNAKEK